MDKYRTPNLYKYVLVLKSLVNLRVMQGDLEAARKGREFIKGMLANPRPDKDYIGKAEATLWKLCPTAMMAKNVGADIVDDEVDSESVFWGCVVKEVMYGR